MRRGLQLILFVAWVCTASAFAEAQVERPNIVFILIDDLGWTDVGCMGSDYYETPHVDRLAANGLLFTSAYANAPNCAPSRACLMSGQYTPRHGVFTVGDPARGNDKFRKLVPTPNRTDLPDEIVTVAERLQTAGYRTASMGKWHLGADPTTQGFDVNVAGREWGSPSGGGYHSPYRYPNLVAEEPGEYLTDRLTTEACRFIEESKDRPFFLYLTHYSVHTPIQPRKDLLKKYRQKPKGTQHKRAAYAAMVESVDESVGRVLAQLDNLALSERTVVIFYSDNGGFGGATSNAPLRGAKGMLYEGGIREPLIVRWPGRVPAGTRCSEPVIGVDFYPTLLEVAGITPPDDDTLDGVSLLPLLKDPTADLDRAALFWHFPCYLQGSGGRDSDRPFRTTPAGAIRMGDWKLIEYFEDGGLELFNLREDLSESHNLADDRPSKRDELHATLRAWRRETDAPVPTEPNPAYER